MRKYFLYLCLLSSQEERQRNTKAMAAAEKELPEMSLGSALGGVGSNSMCLDINIEKLQYAEMMSQVEEDTKDFIMDVSPIFQNIRKKTESPFKSFCSIKIFWYSNVELFSETRAIQLLAVVFHKDVSY